MNRIPRFLRASADLLSQINARIAAQPDLHGLQATGAVSLEAASSDKAAPRRFSIEAYNGGAMNFWWSDEPVVVDLAGMEISAKARPILKDHRPELVVGHSDSANIIGGKSLKVTGIASGTGQAAREVIANSDNGFPWQASIGAEMKRVERIPAGEQVTVNAQKFNGPLLVVRASRLAEVSFVALGADDSTAARMIAARNNHTKTNTPQRKPVVKHKITLVALLALAAAHSHLAASLHEHAEIVPEGDDAAKDGEKALKAWAESQVAPAPEAETAGDEGDRVKSLKAQRLADAAESKRVAAIRRICAGRTDNLEADSIVDGSTADSVELKVLRASRAIGPNIGGRNGAAAMTAEVLEVAVLQASRVSAERLKPYGERVLEAAHKAFRSHISLGELFIAAARANGYTGGAIKVDREILSAAFGLNAGFSTIDVGGILGNVANKSILDAFMHVDQSWRAITAIGSNNDFKTATRYRMTGDLQYEALPAGGKIKHGTVGEESFTATVATFAKMLSITRNDIINDDLGAFQQKGKMLGRGAALKLCDVFWTAYLDDSAFFNTDNSRLNYFSGAATNLQVSSLTTAVQKFRDQKDANGKPLGVAPKILLVPSSLEVTAKSLMQSTEVRDTTASTKYGTLNPFAGNFAVAVSPYLNNSAYTGFSATAWYLLADPNDLPVIETTFLNGQESPTIESAAADFDELGVQMRGYHDFGVAKQDPRAGVKSKGAA